MNVLLPPGWPRPKGYANGIVAEGRQVYIAGQIGWTAEAKLVSDDFVAQVEQALANIVQVLAEAGGEPGLLHLHLGDEQAGVAPRPGGEAPGKAVARPAQPPQDQPQGDEAGEDREDRGEAGQGLVPVVPPAAQEDDGGKDEETLRAHGRTDNARTRRFLGFRGTSGTGRPDRVDRDVVALHADRRAAAHRDVVRA